nr:unnamed protein product [Digitaria exilis]
MPRPPSKRAKRAEASSDEERSSGESEEESFSASESDGDDEGEQSSEELETVQADFAFFDPKPSDFHGVRLLLKTYLDSKPWDLTGFVDLILEQTTVGTVVKLADDEEEGEGVGGDNTDDDLFGLISVLNLGRYAEQRCIKDLKDYLLSVCSDKDTKKQLKYLLEEKASSVGLLVCRRFPTKELRDSFRFKHYLLVVRILEMKNYKEMGLVMAVKSEAIPKFRKKLEALLSE